MSNISKTTFLSFLYCPKNSWLKIHKPELFEKYELSEFEKHLMEQGNEVESCARNLFRDGVEVVSRGEDACNETIRLMASKIPSIFQATFITDGFIARNDVLSHNPESGAWDLLEIKGTNSLKENSAERDHINDVAFQVSVLNRAGIKLGRYFVVHLNKEYVRNGDLDIQDLFIKEDITEKVLEKLPEIENKMKVAHEYLSQEKEPSGSCECVYKSRRNHCTTFSYINSHVPEYSVHDISYISKTRLDELIEQDIFDIMDVPEDSSLSDKQKNQVLVHQKQRPVLDREQIQEELSKLKFPLYFFDYEAYGPAIPVFDGFGPYKPIPFQFSLHILRNPNEEPEHVEFLHEKLTDPSQGVAKTLKDKILSGGTVIAWHKSYEQRVNREIGARLQEYASFFDEINKSMYDLEDIFKAELYIHHGFKGRTSIKKVLPTLVPELRYDILNIHDGGQASDAWWKMVSPTTSSAEAKQIAEDLKVYCGLDTYAMYKIWKHLNEL
ncbi:MAG: DUF2779 domain-containing protein [Minisyncoccia bacterium]